MVRLHAWRDDSELTRINRALAEDQWTRTDPEVFALLRQAQQMSSAAEGCSTRPSASWWHCGAFMPTALPRLRPIRRPCTG